MRIHLDAEKCQGHNRCYSLAPELFDVDDLGYATAKNDGVVPEGLEDKARLAVDSRAFPLLIFDPRKGERLKERLSLQGNPAMKSDWWTNPKTSEEVNFLDFARSEGRFGKHFDREGNPSETLMKAQEDRLENWRLLQELAGVL